MARIPMLVAAMLAAATVPALAQPRGSWDETCRRAEVRGNTLSAECRNRDGRWNRSSIRYTDCAGNRVANRDGRLVCEAGGGPGGPPGGGAAQRVPGDWDQSCRDADLRGNVLTAVCRTTDGNWRRTSIRYTECPGNRVRNENGWLVCGQWSGWGESDWRRVPGSWDDTCRDASIRGGILTATCRTSGGRWERSSIAYRECPGDRVRNADGRLVCEGRPGGGGGGLIPGLPGIPGLR